MKVSSLTNGVWMITKKCLGGIENLYFHWFKRIPASSVSWLLRDYIYIEKRDKKGKYEYRKIR